jgi:hypothetical protein
MLVKSPYQVTVISPSVRPEGLHQVRRSLKRQTLDNWQWIIISPLDLKDDDALVLKDPPKEKGDYWSFNKAINKAIKHAEGELIVSVQDYTEFKPDGLEKFWFYFKNGYDKAMISGVGDKYDIEGMKMWEDPRKREDMGTFYECFPNDVEFNYCSVPKKAFYEVGGFDEYLDKFAGMDHISFQERLDDIGYKFYLDQTNESHSLYHPRLPEWDERHAMHGGYKDRKLDLIHEGIWPVLSYLE